MLEPRVRSKPYPLALILYVSLPVMSKNRGLMGRVWKTPPYQALLWCLSPAVGKGECLPRATHTRHLGADLASLPYLPPQPGQQVLSFSLPKAVKLPYASATLKNEKRNFTILSPLQPLPLPCFPNKHLQWVSHTTQLFPTHGRELVSHLPPMLPSLWPPSPVTKWPNQ